MKTETTGIRIEGKDVRVPSARVEGCTIIVTGGVLKTAGMFDEELAEKSTLPDPALLISALRRTGLRPDLYSFGRAYWDRPLDQAFHSELDNAAVASTSSFEEWWNALPQSTRRNVRLAEKRGVVVRPVEFEDTFVSGIKRIYDETPVRQGRSFWHYKKELSKVREENATYLTRSQFLGAFLQDELIGFVKYIRVDQTAVLSQILAMEAQRDLKPVNALVKHAVELCQVQGMTSLVYGKFDYGAGADSSLAEFKRRNGFVEKKYPRYVVPISTKGRVAISTGLHRGYRELIPAPLMSLLRKSRARLVAASKKTNAQEEA